MASARSSSRISQDTASTARWCTATTSVRVASSHVNAMTSPLSGARRSAAWSAAPATSVPAARTTVTSRTGSVRRDHTPWSTRSRSRSAGCVATTARAARSASANPVPSGAASVLAWANRASDPPSSRRRSMIGVGGSGPSSWRAGADTAGRGARVPRCSASARGVLSRNTSRGAIARPSALARLITVMATMLSPPAAKKSVSASGSEPGSAVAKMPTSAASAEPLPSADAPPSHASPSDPSPPRASPSRAPPLSGGVSAARSVSALRSSFPLTVSGRASTGSTRPGTMCAGSFADSSAVRSAGTGPTTCATRWSSLSATVTAASTTPSRSRRADSTSPGSMRKPFSWTWSSARPTNSSSPSIVRRARSPVWYMREPSALNGSATNLPAVSPGLPR